MTSGASHFGLSGRVAIVTGAAQGIGKAIASRLNAAGAAVMAVDVRPVTWIVDDDTIASVECDVSREADVESMVDETVCRFGRLDILVNNAGIFRGGTVLDLTEDSVDQQLAVNFKGVVFGIKHAGARMAPGSAIVSVASHAGLRGVPALGGYVASKAAIIGYTKTAALELASRGIRVNCVCPGTIDTAINHGSEEGAQELRAAVRLQPLGRIGEPDEVAALVHFLVSADCEFITGQAIAIDGGKTAGPAAAMLEALQLVPDAP